MMELESVTERQMIRIQSVSRTFLAWIHNVPSFGLWHWRWRWRWRCCCCFCRRAKNWLQLQRLVCGSGGVAGWVSTWGWDWGGYLDLIWTWNWMWIWIAIATATAIANAFATAIAVGIA